MRISIGDAAAAAVTQNPLGSAAVVLALRLAASVGVLIRKALAPWTRRGMKARTEWLLLTYLITSICLSVWLTVPDLSHLWDLRDVAQDPMWYVVEKFTRAFVLTLIAPFVWAILALGYASGPAYDWFLALVVGGSTVVGAVLAAAITYGLPRLGRRREKPVNEA